MLHSNVRSHSRAMGGRRTLTKPLSALVGVVSLCATGQALAGAPYKAVWYPDGSIQWFNRSVENAQSAGDPSGEHIVDAMEFLGAHTPLDVTAAATESGANLIFKKNILLPSGSGMCDFYWDENRSDANKTIELSPNGTIWETTVVHEVGHALGLPHEFQRDDRDSFVDVCFNVDPFNYGKQGSAYWPDPYYKLSPYDYGSIMHIGYSSCVTPIAGIPQQTRSYLGITNWMSVHDINSMYRMYAGSMGANGDGDRYGHAVATGDFDDDGYEDIAVAKSDTTPGSTSTVVRIVFYKGVEIDTAATGARTRYMPWFVEEIGTASVAAPQTALAAGDFNGDGIDDLAVGQPWYDDSEGRVQILFLNSTPSDANQPTPSHAPWGRKGVKLKYTISPTSVGLSAAMGKFGQALAAGNLTASKSTSTPYDDLIIGAPQYQSGIRSGGAVVVVKGREQATVVSFTHAGYSVVYNPGLAGDEFGKAISVIPGFCDNDSTADQYNDGFVVGAPSYQSKTGKVYVYDCAANSSHALISPTLLTSVTGAQSGARYGDAVAGFRRRTSSVSPTYKYYAVIGAPDYVGTGTNPDAGIVYLDEYAIGTGAKTFIEDFRPSTRSGDDNFGAALAVQQTVVSSSVPEAGKEVYIAIGMPKTQVSGQTAGKVYIWRPWNSDGTINLSATVISASNPSDETDTLFGHAIATLRNLDTEGGFVVGAPKALLADGTEAGNMKVLLNTSPSSYAWSTWSVELEQESEGDSRPTN